MQLCLLHTKDIRMSVCSCNPMHMPPMRIWSSGLRQSCDLAEPLCAQAFWEGFKDELALLRAMKELPFTSIVQRAFRSI